MLQFKSEAKVCKCGRDIDHTHETMEQYVIISEDINSRSELLMHGYDGEDDHIYDFIRECKRENPNTSYKVQLLRTTNL